MAGAPTASDKAVKPAGEDDTKAGAKPAAGKAASKAAEPAPAVAAAPSPSAQATDEQTAVAAVAVAAVIDTPPPAAKPEDGPYPREGVLFNHGSFPLSCRVTGRYVPAKSLASFSLTDRAQALSLRDALTRAAVESHLTGRIEFQNFPQIESIAQE